MKKLALILMVMVAGLSITSCNKIVENKIDGTYRADRVFKNGNDNTQAFNLAFPNYKLVLADGGTYVISYTLFGTLISESGSWEVTEGGKKVVIVPADTSKASSTWVITERKKDSLKVQYTDNTDVYNYEFIRI